MQILDLLGIYFDVVVVEVKTLWLLFRLALAILWIALKFHNANQIVLNILAFINVFFYLHFWKKILTEETYNSLPGKIDTCAQKWVSRNTNFESNWTKVEWHKISICKCEFFLTFNVEKHFAIWIGQVQ